MHTHSSAYAEPQANLPSTYRSTFLTSPVASMPSPCTSPPGLDWLDSLPPQLEIDEFRLASVEHTENMAGNADMDTWAHIGEVAGNYNDIMARNVNGLEDLIVEGVRMDGSVGAYIDSHKNTGAEYASYDNVFAHNTDISQYTGASTGSVYADSDRQTTSHTYIHDNMHAYNADICQYTGQTPPPTHTQNEGVTREHDPYAPDHSTYPENNGQTHRAHTQNDGMTCENNAYTPNPIGVQYTGQICTQDAPGQILTHVRTHEGYDGVFAFRKYTSPCSHADDDESENMAGNHDNNNHNNNDVQYDTDMFETAGNMAGDVLEESGAHIHVPEVGRVYGDGDVYALGGAERTQIQNLAQNNNYVQDNDHITQTQNPAQDNDYVQDNDHITQTQNPAQNNDYVQDNDHIYHRARKNDREACAHEEFDHSIQLNHNYARNNDQIHQALKQNDRPGYMHDEFDHSSIKLDCDNTCATQAVQNHNDDVPRDYGTGYIVQRKERRNGYEQGYDGMYAAQGPHHNDKDTEQSCGNAYMANGGQSMFSAFGPDQNTQENDHVYHGVERSNRYGCTAQEDEYMHDNNDLNRDFNNDFNNDLNLDSNNDLNRNLQTREEYVYGNDGTSNRASEVYEDRQDRTDHKLPYIHGPKSDHFSGNFPLLRKAVGVHGGNMKTTVYNTHDINKPNQEYEYAYGDVDLEDAYAKNVYAECEYANGMRTSDEGEMHANANIDTHTCTYTHANIEDVAHENSVYVNNLNANTQESTYAGDEAHVHPRNDVAYANRAYATYASTHRKEACTDDLSHSHSGEVYTQRPHGHDVDANKLHTNIKDSEVYRGAVAHTHAHTHKHVYENNLKKDQYVYVNNNLSLKNIDAWGSPLTPEIWDGCTPPAIPNLRL